MSLTLEFVPYSKIEGLKSSEKIKKLLSIAKQDKIVLLEGRLSREEEAELIKTTMEEIDKQFKGIELAVIYPGTESQDFLKKIKANVLNVLAGNRLGLTIIGPANIVTDIKKNSNKIIELLTKGGASLASPAQKKKKHKNR